MIISERCKGKSTCLFKCDECNNEWQGNYYVMGKRDIHLCPSCSFKKGWKKKFKENPKLIPLELKYYIIKRLDGESLDTHLPKRKNLKIIIKCSECGYERRSNSYDVLTKQSTKCNSCKQKSRSRNPSTKMKQEKLRRGSTKYRKMMSESMKKSKAWKETQHIRIAGVKEYWKKVRGGKELHEVYDEWELYRKTVYKMTESEYRKFKNMINPKSLLRGKRKYHIDHKFSLLEGFKNNIPPYIIAHYTNLQMLKSSENISKGCKCDINMDELMRGVFAHSSGI